MKLLQKIHQDTADKKRSDLTEDAAVGGGAVAGVSMPLFSTLVKRNVAIKATDKPEVIKFSSDKKKKKNPSIGLAKAFRALSEDIGAGGDVGSATKNFDQKFDTTEVIAKLKGLEAKEKQDHRDTVTFGLEDDNGGLVKVTVSSDQAEEFEKALQAFMTDYDESSEVPEIAEILFKLKDRFDIVDVAWPEVQEDEEQDVALQGGDQQTDPSADPNADPDADPNADPMADPMAGGDMAGGADEGQVKDLLTQVIDMMKADADARKAEARAKEAEAKAKEADAIVAQAMSKVKQEEQYLDMETYNKSKKDEDREAKRLANLAKWKHQMSSEEGIDSDDDAAGGDLSSMMQQMPQRGGREEEETVRRPSHSQAQPPKKGSTVKGRVHPHDVARFILNRVK